jgi:fibronectin-binding autotransporter adhesin
MAADAGAARMAAINWVGGSGDWDNGALWNGGAVPTSTDTVQIAIPGVTVTVSTAGDAAYSLTTSASTLDITGGSLFTISSASFGGAYEQSGGLYMCSGAGASFMGGIAMTGGTMEALAGATLNIASGGSLAGTVSGTGTLSFSGGTSFINAGFHSTISSIVVSADLGFNTNFTTSSDFTEQQNGIVDLFGHTLTSHGDVQIDGTLSNGVFGDAGTLTLGAPSNTTNLTNGLVLKVSGKVIQSGNANFGAGDAGAKIVVGRHGQYIINGNWNIGDPSSVGSITTAGLFEKTGGGKISTVNVGFSSTGTIKVQTGTLMLNGLVNAVSGTVSGAGTLGIGGGITTFGTKLSLGSLGSLDQQSGILVLNKALSFGGEWDQNGGVLNLNSTGATLSLTGASNFDGGTITGYGGTMKLSGRSQMGNVTIGGPDTLTISGVLDQTNTITFGESSNPLATILAGATWFLEGDSQIEGSFGLIDNQGSFIDPNGSGLATVSAEFDSSGTVTANNGTLQFAGPTVLAGIVNGSGMLDLAGGTTLEGGVAITVAELDVNAAVSLAGNLSYAQAFSETRNGTIDLNANTLTLSGTASFDGGSLEAGGVLVASGASTVFDYTIENSTLKVTGSADQTSDLAINGGTLLVASGGVYSIDDDDGITTNGNGGALVLAGMLIASGTGNSTISAVIDQTGTIEIDDRTVFLANGGTLAGKITGAGTLALSGGTFTGASGLSIGSGALALQANATLALTVNESFGGYVADAGTLSIASGATLSLTGTTLIDGNAALSGGGTLLTSGDTTLSALTIGVGANLMIAGTAEQGPNNVTVGAGGALTVTSSGNYTLDANQSIQGSGVLDVAGTLTANSNGNSVLNPAIVDAGQIVAALGTLTVTGIVTGHGGFTISATGTLDFSNSATITASNTVSFGAGGGLLILQDEANGVVNYGATIANFAAHDGIQFADLTASSTTITEMDGGLQYTIADANNSVTLTFTTAQTPSALFIGTTSDGHAILMHH